MVKKGNGIEKLQTQLKCWEHINFQAQQTSIRTRQQLQQAGLGEEAEKMYRPISTIPKKTMLQALQREGESAVNETQKNKLTSCSKSTDP